MSAFAAFKGRSPSVDGDNQFLPRSRVYYSNFSSSKQSENSTFFNLIADQYIVIHGLFLLKVVSGLVNYNRVCTIAAGEKVYEVIAPKSQAAPVLFAPVEACIEILNYDSGLHLVGSYHPPLRNIVFSGADKTYCVVERVNQAQVLHVDDEWLKALKILSKCLSTMIVGRKGSGKSTFSKLLLNSVVHKTPCCYLDIDPGQTEFSIPYTLSLTKVSDICLGQNMPLPEDETLLHYYGFCSPQNMPTRYLHVIKELFRVYNTKYREFPLIINTPGWIKGFGEQLLTMVSEALCPDQVVFLNDQDEETVGLLKALTKNSSVEISPSSGSGEYTAAQLRTFNKLNYFHQTHKYRYDYLQHLLDRAPLRLSYDPESQNCGIHFVTILNCDQGFGFDASDVFTMLETTMVGVYAVPEGLVDKFEPTEPKYLNSTDFCKLDMEKMDFLGLSMVHSVEKTSKIVSLYFPLNNSVPKKIQHHVLNGCKIIIVKGEGDIPVCDMVHPEFIEEYKQTQKVIPYVLFGEGTRGEGVWRIRKNLQRKNQKQ